jgi:Thiamine pyrophosphate enzyme, N-terminal TPP binding domain
MSRTVAEVLVDVFEEVGVKQALGLIGDSLNPLGDAVRQSKIDWVGVRHEEGAALAAAGQAKLTGRLRPAQAPGSTRRFDLTFDFFNADWIAISVLGGSKTMIGQLTRAERQHALLILLGLALCGLIFGIAGKDDPLGIHGALIGVAALGGIFKVISVYYDPEPGDERLNRYCDDPTKFGVVLAMIWAVFGLFIGDWVAWLLVKPDFTFDPGWASFGRLRPIHTTGVRAFRLRRQRPDRHILRGGGRSHNITTPPAESRRRAETECG